MTGGFMYYVGVLFKLLRPAIKQIISWLNPDSPTKFSRNFSRLLETPASQLVKEIKSGKVKATDVLKAYARRIDEVNPVLNAFCETGLHDALRETERVDSLIESGDNLEILKSKPLLGIPISIKNSTAVKGMTLDCGLMRFKGQKATKDSYVVSKLREAGAVILGITNVPEALTYWETKSVVHGVTLHPYDLSRNPGGSSGGEGSAIGSAMSLIGIGSDMLGSIRLPAANCGIYGHKPTARVIKSAFKDIFPEFPESLDEYVTLGPMTRYASDLKLMMQVLTEDEYRQKMRLDEDVELSKIKIFYMTDPNNEDLTPITDEIENVMIEAMTYLESNFKCKVEKVDLKGRKDLFKMFMGAIRECKVPPLVDLVWGPDHDKNLNWELFKSLFNQSDNCTYTLLALKSGRSKITEEELAEFAKLRNDFKNEVFSLLGDDGVLFYPTVPYAATKLYATGLATVDIGYAGLFNALNCPATHVPMGLSPSEGLPIGFSIATAPFCDRLSFALAEELEKEFGGWVQP